MPDVFEQYAQAYDDWFEQHEAAYRAELAAVAALLPTEGRGIEIGVGTGRFAGPLKISLGVEPAWAMATLAKKRGIQVVQGRAEALPLAPASCDFVLMVTVLCFLPDPLAALREISRILKPSGRLILAVLDPDSPLGRQYEAKKDQSRFFREARFYRLPQIREWLEALGFREVARSQNIFHDPATLLAPEPVRPSSGEGAFVVLAAQKTGTCRKGHLS